MPWERCGNTSFYKQLDPTRPGGFYVNPFNWTQIVISGVAEQGQEEGAFSVLYRRSPKYKWDALKAGAQASARSEEDRMNILKHTHAWFADLTRAKDLNLSVAQLRNIFQALPGTIQADILRGVGALVDGLDAMAIENLDAPVKGTMVLVVPNDTPAAQYIPVLQGNYDHIFLAESLEHGVDQALELFGILEC